MQYGKRHASLFCSVKSLTRTLMICGSILMICGSIFMICGFVFMIRGTVLTIYVVQKLPLWLDFMSVVCR